MSRLPISDPRVQYAMRKRSERHLREQHRSIVLRALERRDGVSIQELIDTTGLTRHDCCEAIDELRIEGAAVLEESGKVRLLELQTFTRN